MATAPSDSVLSAAIAFEFFFRLFALFASCTCLHCLCAISSNETHFTIYVDVIFFYEMCASASTAASTAASKQLVDRAAHRTCTHARWSPFFFFSIVFSRFLISFSLRSSSDARNCETLMRCLSHKERPSARVTQ